eukprot:4673646-Amphidinium_carterae.1
MISSIDYTCRFPGCSQWNKNIAYISNFSSDGERVDGALYHYDPSLSYPLRAFLFFDNGYNRSSSDV